jgi:hypothetical protein
MKLSAKGTRLKCRVIKVEGSPNRKSKIKIILAGPSIGARVHRSDLPG